jgi:hypothetical protein
MRYLHGSVGVFLVCMATVVDAQVKCNAVSYTVDDGWCKGKSVSFKACYDASKPDTDSQSKAALIKMSQLAEKVYTKDMCLNGAKEMCSWVGGTPKAWDCTDVNNECSGDNVAGRISGACSTDAQCQGFAASSYAICCDSWQDIFTKWVCDNVDQKKLDALKVAPNCVDMKVDKDCRKASSATLSRASILHTFVVSAIAVVLAAITAV